MWIRRQRSKDRRDNYDWFDVHACAILGFLVYILLMRRATSIHLHVVPFGYCRPNPVAKRYSAA